MAQSPPLLDTRTIDDIMEGLRKQAQTDLPLWKQLQPDDAGAMLQRIFARLMEIALQRLNRVPEKNLLAFLDAMGVSVRPASPAKAPLTFSLLPNVPPTFLPGGAQVGTKPSVQAPAMIFETMRDFTVVPAQLVRAFTMDPVWDRFADRTGAIAGLQDAGFAPFVGVERMPHVLFVGDDTLLNCTVPVFVTLEIAPSGADDGFWGALIYEYVSGGALISARLPTSNSGPLLLTLDKTVDETTVAGVGLQAPARSRWVQVSLPAPITDFVAASGVKASAITLSVRNQSSFAPDMAFSDQTPLDLTKDFLPFGSTPGIGSCLYLSSAEAFAKPNSSVTLNVDVAPSYQVVLAWEHFDADRNAWFQLPAGNIQDGTKGLEKPDTISVVLPAGSTAALRTPRAIRARLASGAYRGFPSITKLDIRDTAELADKVTGSGSTGSPQTATIRVKTSAIAGQGDPAPAFAAVGQILAIGKDQDQEFAVVTNSFDDRLIIMPAPAKTHLAGATVQLKYAQDVGTLSKPAEAGATSLQLSAIGSTQVSSILLIYDTAAIEFVTVKSFDGTTANLTASLQFGHKTGTSIALVMTEGLHLYGMANGRWVDTDTIKKDDPFVPFGTRPGPGNFFQLYAYFSGSKPDGPPTGDGTSGPASTTAGPAGTSPQVQINFHLEIDKNLPKVDIAWEYFGASGWTATAATDKTDTTNSFQNDGTGKVDLTLGTLVPGQVNNQQGYWIRARIADGSYGVPLTYMAVDPSQPALGYAVVPGSGNLHPPILNSLTLDYVTKSKSPERLVTQNGFLYSDRSGTSDPFAPFVPVTDLVPFEQADPEPAFYLGFDAAFPEQPVTLYFDAKARTFSTGIVREISMAPSLMDRLPALRWEYFNGAVWTALAVVDWTGNLTETGELEFLTPLDIQPLSRFDSVARYWIRARSVIKTKALQEAEADRFSNDPLTTQELTGVFVNTTTVLQGISVTGEVLGF